VNSSRPGDRREWSRPCGLNGAAARVANSYQWVQITYSCAKFRFMWNARGLNGLARRSVVREFGPPHPAYNPYFSACFFS
jgi:hypothetical protein